MIRDADRGSDHDADQQTGGHHPQRISPTLQLKDFANRRPLEANQTEKTKQNGKRPDSNAARPEFLVRSLKSFRAVGARVAIDCCPDAEADRADRQQQNDETSATTATASSVLAVNGFRSRLRNSLLRQRRSDGRSCRCSRSDHHRKGRHGRIERLEFHAYFPFRFATNRMLSVSLAWQPGLSTQNRQMSHRNIRWSLSSY